MKGLDDDVVIRTAVLRKNSALRSDTESENDYPAHMTHVYESLGPSAPPSFAVLNTRTQLNQVNHCARFQWENATQSFSGFRIEARVNSRLNCCPNVPADWTEENRTPAHAHVSLPAGLVKFDLPADTIITRSNII